MSTYAAERVNKSFQKKSLLEVPGPLSPPCPYPKGSLRELLASSEPSSNPSDPPELHPPSTLAPGLQGSVLNEHMVGESGV